jgi:hypothetical protein
VNRNAHFKACASGCCFLAVSALVATLDAWGGQGHRLVGLIAANHLTTVARQNMTWLLDQQTLADVSVWADQQIEANQQTYYWHFLNIPPDAPGYDRDRDCPRQPGVKPGDRADRWRDCAVDRILYHQQRLADTTLDRADRATALKFLVHFVGDLHQPFHALGVERGGNGIFVRVFGATNCGNDPAKPTPCNLHAVWDSRLIAHRGLNDQQYLALLTKTIAARQLQARPTATSADWANESFKLARPALLPQNGDVNEAYYQTHIPVIDERVALAGLRLAAVLNAIFTTPPPAQ